MALKQNLNWKKNGKHIDTNKNSNKSKFWRNQRQHEETSTNKELYFIRFYLQSFKSPTAMFRST